MLCIAAREAFRMHDLASLALYDHVAEKQVLADTDAAYTFAQNDGLVVTDEFALVVRYFVIVNDQFVRENRIPITGNSAGLKFVSHSSLNLSAKVQHFGELCKKMYIL